MVATLRPSLDNLAFSPDDRLFVSNMADNGIYEVDTESGEVRTLVEGKLSVPAGIALWEGPDGAEIHVADTFAYRVVDPASGDVREVRRMWGQSLEELDYPIWASVDDDHVLLTSWTSSTVQVVDRASGESLEMLHGFAAPVAAVELADGRIAVAEIGGALLIIDAVDRSVRTPVVEDLAAPVGMVLVDDSGSSVYVTEVGSGSLNRYDLSSGERTVVATGLALPEGLAVRADGSVVVAEVGARRLVAIDPADGAITVLAEGLPVGLPAPVGLPPGFVPTGVAVAADGTVYFSSDLDNSIYRVDG